MSAERDRSENNETEIDIMPIERRLSFLSWTLDVERWTLDVRSR